MQAPAAKTERVWAAHEKKYRLSMALALVAAITSSLLAASLIIMLSIETASIALDQLSAHEELSATLGAASIVIVLTLGGLICALCVRRVTARSIAGRART